MYHSNATVEALMKRAYLFLEDHEWKSAKGYFDDSLVDVPVSAKPRSVACFLLDFI